MAVSKTTKVAALLVDKNVVSSEQLEQVMDETMERGDQAMIRTIVRTGIATPDQINKALGEHFGIPHVDLKETHIDPQVPHLLQEEFLRRHNIVPVGIEDNEIVVALSPPVDPSILDEVELMTGYHAKPVIAFESDITFAINHVFSTERRTHQTLIDIHVEEHAPTIGHEVLLDEIVDTIEAPPVVRLVMDIIDGAIHERASDIHMEPQESEMRVRYRVDGVLHDIMHIPHDVETSVISRIKILASLDITERRLPQDGHIAVKRQGRDFDIRVSTFMTVNGEKVVMRLLNKETMLRKLEDLGLNPHDLKVLKTLTSKPYGMILVTGPTGSGKTTTLYSILNRLNHREENIMTIEDPVEYKLPGINQSQINPTIGITFASGLRSMLRQDPNIIMVGEIRDEETAAISVQSSLTGHLVFSTMHTNDAPSVVTRLSDMSVKPYMLSSSIVGVIAQRLVRTICPACKESHRVDVMELCREFNLSSTKRGKALVWRGKGCRFCGNSGYHGRIGIFELMPLSDEIRRAILREEPANVIRRLAIREGMSTLHHSAFRKVVEGTTTIDEVRRAVFMGAD